MLRVFLSSAPEPDRADLWVRFADDGRVIGQGRDTPSRWPGDRDLDVVLAAGSVRLATLALPPMSAGRLRAAARYALEDQMATVDDACVAVAYDGDAGIAAIASQATIDALRAMTRAPRRVVPESALAPASEGWTWYGSAGGGGFVRMSDGSTFATSPVEHGGVPSEVRAALAQATRANRCPPVVSVAGVADSVLLERWSTDTGTRFAAAPPWRWTDASSAVFAGAPDFLDDGARPDATSAHAGGAARFRTAITLALLAVLIHVGALVAQWAWLNVTSWQLARATVEQAKSSGIADAATPAAAVSAVARRNASLRHQAGRYADGDAVPLLGRAAAPLEPLAAGRLKSATYDSDAWTFDFGNVEPAALSAATRALREAGVDAVVAPTPAGVRVRIAADAAPR